MRSSLLFTEKAVELSRGAASPLVRGAQDYLARFGWARQPGQSPIVRVHDQLPEVEPGSFDEATEAAIADFQRFAQLPVTGRLDLATIAAMRQPRCGYPDRTPVSGPSQTSSHNGEVGTAKQAFTLLDSKWDELQLTYHLSNSCAELSNGQVLNALRRAYRSWSLISKLVVKAGDDGADIEVSFESFDHGDGKKNAFDGAGGVLAHAASPGGGCDLHFDESETWTRDVPSTGTDLDSVALHEAGHTLGLDHSKVAGAVMRPFFNAGSTLRKLQPDDIAGMRKLYGKRGRNIWSDIQAAVDGEGKYSGKGYFFKNDKYLRYDWGDDLPDAGYSKEIQNGWTGLPFTSGIDAAVNGQKGFAGKLYFFKGDEYARFNWALDIADPGYPKKIANGWHGLPNGFTSDFDAAVSGKGKFAGKLYFFKGDEYVRYDWAKDKADAGYPKKIANGWHGLPESFQSGIQAALNGQEGFAGKLYFFKGDQYVRYDWLLDMTDLGYPKQIEFNWL